MTRLPLLGALGLAALCGCETIKVHQSFVFGSEALREGFEGYARSAPAESQSSLATLRADSRVRIHLVPGRISDLQSRGGVSGPHASSATNARCLSHPGPEEGVVPEFDWDVFVDEAQQARSADAIGLETSLEELLQHEILGHFMRCYTQGKCTPADPRSAEWAAAENEAIAAENVLRRHLGRRLIGWSFSAPPVPVRFVEPRQTTHGKPVAP